MIRASDSWRIFTVPSVCLAFAMLLASPPVAATDRPVAEVLALSPEALARFMELQDGWLEWLAAAYQGDRSRAFAAVDRLLADSQAIGMERLPDLSLGAAGRAVGFAREGRFDVAAWCLTAAERFDPERPEIAFAAARVARLEGRHAAALGRSLEAFSRLFKDRLLSHIWRADLGHWLLFVVLAAGALYVAVMMATNGIELSRDVFTFVKRFVPDVVALAVTLLLLLWPLVLPAGLLWLVVYWSILLWGYGSLFQRLALVGLWVVLGVAPMLVNEQRQRVRVGLAPTTLAMESLATGRLQGSLFGDLAALRAALPLSTAVQHQLGDLHCRLGEWRSARQLYEEVVDREPDNGPVWLNLGVCSFHLGDQVSALESFLRAAEFEDSAAAARFNMSQVLSQQYRFREAERELNMAQQLAPRLVGGWLRRAADQRVVSLDSGFARSAEIRGQLAMAWRGEEADARWSAVWPRVLSLPLALAFVLIAAGVHFVVRRESRVVYSPVDPVAPIGTLREILLPGLAESEAERPILAFLAILVLVVILSLPLSVDLGYRLPWIFSPGFGLWLPVAAFCLVVYLFVRVVRSRRGIA